MRKLIISLLSLFLFPAIVFGQAIRVPTLEVLIGGTMTGKRVEQLDIPSELFTGTSSGKRVNLTARDFISGISANGTTTSGNVNLVVVGDGTSTTTYAPETKKGTITVTVTASAKPTIQEGGVTIGTVSSGINFNADSFDLSQSGGTTTINLSSSQQGTTSVSGGHLIRQHNSGMLPTTLMPLRIIYGSFTAAPSISSDAMIPADNTLPQNTEGEEIFTFSYTPFGTNTTLIIDVGVYAGGTDSSYSFITALFKDSETDARNVNYFHASTAGEDWDGLFVMPSYAMQSPGTGSITFKVRGGSENVGRTIYINQGHTATTLRFGNLLKSFWKITEYR